MLTVIGSPLSPFARKTLVALRLKQLPFECDPVVSFFTSEEFTALGPLRRVPVLILNNDTSDSKERVALTDSSAINEFLEERYAGRGQSLFGAAALGREGTRPQAVLAVRARMRALEEFADTTLADKMVWGLWASAILGPGTFGKGRDKAAIARAVEEIGPALDLVEKILTPDLLEEDMRMNVGSIAVTAMARTAELARYKIDPERWPKTSGLVQHCMAHPAFASLKEVEDTLIRLKPVDHPEALRKLNFPVTPTTMLKDQAPVRGPVTRQF
jgi:glutathione S-transferase